MQVRPVSGSLRYIRCNNTVNPGFLPFSSCKVLYAIARVSGVMHEASAWFTVILVGQRIFCVSSPFSARRRVNAKSSLLCMFLVLIFILGLTMLQVFDMFFLKVRLNDTLKFTETCELSFATWVKDPVLYESILVWLKIVRMKYLPSFLLTIFALAMVKKLLSKPADKSVGQELNTSG